MRSFSSSYIQCLIESAPGVRPPKEKGSRSSKDIAVDYMPVQLQAFHPLLEFAHSAISFTKMSATPKWTQVGPSTRAEFERIATLSRRKHSSRACTACQRRKRKCTGEIPCGGCHTYRTACLVDKETDQRRKLQSRRRLAQLEQTSDVLDGLLELLRDENRIGRSDLHGRLRSSRLLSTIYEDICKIRSPRKPANESRNHKESQNDPHERPNITISTRDSSCIRLLTHIPIHQTHQPLYSSEFLSLISPIHKPQAQHYNGDTKAPVRAQYDDDLANAAVSQPHCREPLFSLQQRDIDGEMLRKLSVQV